MTDRTQRRALLAQVIGGIVLAFLVMPIFAVVPASLNDASFIKIPPEVYSTRWYVRFFEDATWVAALMNSIKVALLATVFSVALGTTAALGIERLPGSLRPLAIGLVLSPLIVPVIMISISLYYVTRSMGLYGTTVGLALSHSLLCLPFVVLNVGVSLKRLDPNLVRAAEGLGAGPWRGFRPVPLPAIFPGLAGGGAFAFVTSFDEVVISIFIAGHGAKTLPVKLWEQIRVEFTPVAAVGSTVILALTIVIFILARWSAAAANKPVSGSDT
ncbi:MAG: ABC transporter permease [Proteobacteria bacterium]|nr:ABC transporter permease [Pseudomonadota bacterium]